MNWEAAFVIGSFTLILGALLYVLGRSWSKRSLRRVPAESMLRLHVTTNGFALIALMVFLFVAGIVYGYFAPRSELGLLLGTPLGCAIFAACLMAATELLAIVFEAFGFRLLRHSDGAARE